MFVLCGLDQGSGLVEPGSWLAIVIVIVISMC
jgi:hypothetical protein